MKQLKKKSSKLLTKRSSKTRPGKTVMNIEDADFFKKKMAKGAKMLAIAGLPKIA